MSLHLALAFDMAAQEFHLNIGKHREGAMLAVAEYVRGCAGQL